MIRLLAVLAAALVLPLAACGDKQDAAAPAPVEIGSESTGYFCGMLLSDHAGPKGQIHLAGKSEPLWFSSVRDAIAFTRMPDEPRDIRAVYVNDMGKAASWAQPGPGDWIAADKAFFVVGSERMGGMGQPEAVPFGGQAAADGFVAKHGGKVLRLSEIPDDYVIGPTDPAAAPGMAGMNNDDAGATGHGAMEGMSHATQQQ